MYKLICTKIFGIIFCLIFSFPLINACDPRISDDIEVEDEFTGAFTSYGNLVSCDIVSDKETNQKSLSITTEDEDVQEFLLEEISENFLSYSDFYDNEYAVLRIEEYILALGYKYQEENELIFAVPRIKSQDTDSDDSNIDDSSIIEDISKSVYRVFSIIDPSYGTLGLSSEGELIMPLFQANNSINAFTGSLTTNGNDGILNFDISSDTDTISGNAVALPGEILILNKGTGNGTIFAFKDSYVGAEEIAGSYSLIVFQITRLFGEQESRLETGSLTVEDDYGYIDIPGITSMEAYMQLFGLGFYRLTDNAHNPVYMHFQQGKNTVFIMSMPTYSTFTYYFAIGVKENSSTE